MKVENWSLLKVKCKVNVDSKHDDKVKPSLLPILEGAKVVESRPVHMQ